MGYRASGIDDWEQDPTDASSSLTTRHLDPARGTCRFPVAQPANTATLSNLMGIRNATWPVSLPTTRLGLLTYWRTPSQRPATHPAAAWHETSRMVRRRRRDQPRAHLGPGDCPTCPSTRAVLTHRATWASRSSPTSRAGTPFLPIINEASGAQLTPAHPSRGNTVPGLQSPRGQDPQSCRIRVRQRKRAPGCRSADRSAGSPGH